MLANDFDPTRHFKPFPFEDHSFYFRCFVKLTTPGSEEAEYATETFQNQMDELSRIFNNLIEKSMQKLPNEVCLEMIQNPSVIAPFVNYVGLEHTKMTKILLAFNEDFYTRAASIVSTLVARSQESFDNGIPVFCSTPEIELYFDSIYKAHELPKTLLRNLRAAKVYVDHYRESPRIPTLPIEHAQVAMKESALVVEESTEYSPHGFFDDFLEIYILNNKNHLAMIEELAREISGQLGKKSVNYRKVEKIVGTIVRELKPTDQREVLVIRCAVTRIFFNRLYLISDSFLKSKDYDEKFMHDCGVFKWQTPAEMEIGKNLMKPDMMNHPFTTLVKRVPLLQQAVAEISSIQFYTNPLDIMMKAFKALKCAEEFVRDNSLENRIGQFISMFEKDKLKSASSQMSFDDFFPLFLALFSECPPVNARNVAHFLVQISGMTPSSALDFAKMFLTSSVQYIESPEKKMKAKEDSDEEDPLGIL